METRQASDSRDLLLSAFQGLGVKMCATVPDQLSHLSEKVFILCVYVIRLYIIYIHVPCVCLVPREARRECQIPWN